MKKIWLLIIPVFVIALSSCNKDDFSGSFAFGETFDLAFGIERTSDDGVMTLSFADIEDSRCPLNVICVWEGQAEVKLSVKIAGEEPVDLELINRVGHPELGIDTLGNFIFTLEDVLPYPEGAEQIDDEDYLLKLRVDEL